jgi:hypothetical protein
MFISLSSINSFDLWKYTVDADVTFDSGMYKT